MKIPEIKVRNQTLEITLGIEIIITSIQDLKDYEHKSLFRKSTQKAIAIVISTIIIILTLSLLCYYFVLRHVLIMLPRLALSSGIRLLG